MTEPTRPGTRRLAATLALAALLVTSVAVPGFAAAPGVAAGAEPGALATPDAAGPTAVPPGVNATEVGPVADADSGIPDGANATNVTLITGQTVTVVDGPNGTDYRVAGDARMRKVETDNATYVYPEGVDFERFDRQLFDVEFLVEQNLTDAETDAIPVIVSGPARPGASADERVPDGVLDAAEGVERRATLDSIGAAAGTVAKARAGAAYRRLAADDAVDRVSLDVKYRLELSDADDAVGASAARRAHGVSGDGVTVAVVDSGIDDSHPAIDDVVAERDFTFEGRTDDPNGHGTHVAGIVASDDPTHTGMAPDASLIDARVLTADGWGYTSWIIAGMDYAVDSGADVVSVSIGGDVGVERSNDRYTDAINSAVARGALVVTSAGNDGWSGYGTVTTPGIQSRALTVGAWNKYTERVAGFSSRGPTKYGYYLKPDLVAPGKDVASAESGTDGFTRKSGTSMAAPAVSGVAALLLEAHPEWSPAQLRGVLTSTADPLDSHVYAQGAGTLDAIGALSTDLVVTPGTVDFGTVRRGRNVSRTVALTNTGDRTVTVEPDAAATDIRDGNTEHVTVNRSTVRVRPGETEHLALAVDTDDVPPGTYSGRLSLGEDHTVIFGFVREHAVTVEKRTLADTSADGDRVWLFADEPGRSNITGRDGLVELNGSSTTYHTVGGGRYHVLSEGRDERTGQPILFERTLTVDGDERVVLNESETVRHELDAPAGESLAARNVTVNYSTTTSAGKEYGGTVAVDDPATPTVRFGPSANLRATIGRLVVSDAGDAAFDAASAYHLIHRVDGIHENRSVSLAPDALATKRVTYRRSAWSRSYDVAMRATAGEFVHAVAGGLGDRRTQTVYVNGGVDGHRIRADSDAWNLSSVSSVAHGAAASHEVGFNRHPFVGDLRWRVDNGTLGYDATAQTDGAGNRFDDAGDTVDSIRVATNGKTRLQKPLTAKSGWHDTGVAVEPGTDLEVTTVGRNGATPLSTQTVTTRRGTYDPNASGPPRLRELSVRNLSGTNAAGEDLRVRFAVDGDAADAEAWLATGAESVPFDGDAGNWTAGAVERVASPGDATVYEATFDPPDGYLGTVDLAVSAVDASGDAVESTTFDAAWVDTRPPRRSNGSVTMTALADGLDAAGNVSLSLSADFANFRETVDATRTADGRVTANLNGLPDDGNYTVRPLIRDGAGNTTQTAPASTLALDRRPPELGATLTKDNATGRVNVSADERLRAAPDVSVTLPNGTATDVAVNATGHGEWTGTFPLADDGAYAVNATGTDRAGNLGRANSTATVATVDARPVGPSAESASMYADTVALASGAFVRLRADEPVNGSVALTGSESALAPLPRNLSGVGFLNGDFEELSGTFANATIGVPVDESELPPGVEPKDIEFRYYDESADAWEERAIEVQNATVNGTERRYWTTNVSHFSTYGAVAVDETPPSVEVQLPDGDVSGADDSPPPVEFTYDDDLSGVDASAVELYFDGRRVTDDPAASVTGERATYRPSELDYRSYNATVTVVDGAGNAVNETTGFEVVGDGEPPAVAPSPTNGTELPAGDDRQTFTFDVEDADGLNAGAVEVRYDGTDVTADAAIDSDGVSYTAEGLADGRNHTIELYLEDRAGANATYRYEFSVAEPEPEPEPEPAGGGSGGDDGGGSSGSGGGGGGGGNVPPPAVQVEVIERGDGRATAEITSARVDAPGRVSPAGGLAGGEVAFRTVGVAPANEGPEPRFLLGLDAAASAPEGAPKFAGAGRTLGYLNVTPTYITDAELDAVTVTFETDAGTTDSPGGVSLYRYDGGWERLDTAHLGTRDGTHRFRASADATGAFAVGLDEPAVEVRDASLDASSVLVGDAVTATATVENTGTAAGTETVGLTVDGETVATREVSLAPGERTTVAFDRAFETAGEYAVAVGGADAGTVEVSVGTAVAEGTTTAGTTAGGGGAEGGNGAGGDSEVPGFGPLAAFAALAVAALAVRRRRA